MTTGKYVLIDCLDSGNGFYYIGEYGYIYEIKIKNVSSTGNTDG